MAVTVDSVTNRQIIRVRTGVRPVIYCGVKLTTKSASLYTVKRSNGRCKACDLNYRRRLYGQKPKIFQVPGGQYTFPCGCSGLLPASSGQTNVFAVYQRNHGYSCRVSGILGGSVRRARVFGYMPVDPKTPHATVRLMMQKKDCVLCHRPLEWELGRGRTPHLHHDHSTGRIIGFSHSRCNPLDLQRRVIQLELKVIQFENSQTALSQAA